ncbi:MAG: class I adenylate-forming enzyme family protein [Gemmatimonadaceae bacterium]
MADLDLLSRLRARADATPRATAIVEPGGITVTYAELSARAQAVARGFTKAGMRPGDRVLFAVRPSVAAIVLMTGIVEAGGVLVPASLGVGDELFRAQMKQLAPRWVVAESLLLAASSSSLVRRIVRWRGGALPPMDCLSDARLVRVGPMVPLGPRTISADAIERMVPGTSVTALSSHDAESPALIVFTSGTTAVPKAVMHSRRSLRATLDLVGGRLAIGDGDVLLSRELHLILPALFAGATVVISRSMRFSAEATLRMLAQFNVTHVFGVTADCQALLQYLVDNGRTLPSTLRHVLIGAAPVHASFMRRFHDVLPPGATAWCIYGMTEMLPVACIALEDKLAFTGDGDVVGTPVDDVCARVTDDGELVLSGPNLFSGYHGERPVVEHHTGDLARIDEGRIVLIGRQKDMIIRREHNIYPALHEPVIASIDGVRHCAMVGVYDDDAADERVVLFIEPEPWCDATTFTQTVERELRIGLHRIDDAAQPDLIVLADVPRSGRSSKVDRVALRELARERLACASL